MKLISAGRGAPGRVARRQLNRASPKLEVAKMVTYAVKSPRSTHTRPGTCEAARCKAFRIGFRLTLPANSDRIAHAKQFIKGELDGIKRSFTLERDGNLVHLWFPKGTPCTRATKHRVSLQRPELYVVRGGDWRGNTGTIRKHKVADHWVEDFEENLARSRRVINGRS